MDDRIIYTKTEKRETFRLFKYVKGHREFDKYTCFMLEGGCIQDWVELKGVGTYDYDGISELIQKDEERIITKDELTIWMIQ
jgi:hypothetical protein